MTVKRIATVVLLTVVAAYIVVAAGLVRQALVQRAIIAIVVAAVALLIANRLEKAEASEGGDAADAADSDTASEVSAADADTDPQSIDISPATPALVVGDELARTVAATTTELTKVQAEILKLTAAIGDLYAAANFLSRTVETAGVDAVQQVTATANHLRNEANVLNASLVATAALISKTPSLASRTQFPQPVESDPEIRNSVRRYLRPLIANMKYRNGIGNLVTDRTLVDDIREHLIALLQLSGTLYAQSRLRRGESSPRMVDWGKDNANAEEALSSYGPLLERLRHIDDLTDSEEAENRFVEGLYVRELQVMSSLLAQKAEVVSNEQQLKTFLRLGRETLAKRWLTPAIRLYQLVFEAVRIEDREMAATALSREEYDVQRARSGLRPARDAFRDAAAALEYNYVHYDLYVTDPQTTRFDLSQGAIRRRFADWIEGELSRDSDDIPVIARDALGRVMMPRFESDESRHTLEGKLMIIVGGA